MQALCFPASSLPSSSCKGQPRQAPGPLHELGGKAEALTREGARMSGQRPWSAQPPLVPLAFTCSEGNRALPRLDYPKRPSGIWPKA